MIKIFLVCHAGPKIGLGHLKRCLSIAKELIKNQNTSVEFIIQSTEIFSSQADRYQRHFVRESKNFIPFLRSKVSYQKPSAIIFDLHPTFISKELEEFLDNMGHQGVARIGIDSVQKIQGINKLIDFLCLPTFYAPSNELERIKIPLRYGWDYFLIDVDQKDQSLKQPQKRDVLVLTGGSDVTYLADILPGKLDKSLPKDCKVTWICGPFSQGPNIDSNSRLTWNIVNSPYELLKFMRSCDFALTIYGVSLFELLAHGVPTVVFSPYGNRDLIEMKALASFDIACVSDNMESAILDLNYLISNPNEANRISSNATKTIDGKGAQRLANDIFDLILKPVL